MSPPVNPVQSDSRVPDRTGVVVVGGGIIGACTALFLAEKGHAVVLCEKGRIGGEQSSRNWGWCRTMGRDVDEIPMAIESLRLWRGMNARTQRETGYRQAGIVYLCETEKEMAEREKWLAEARQYQVDARVLRGAAMDAVVPGASSLFIGALHTPTDGRAEPSHAAPAIAEAARDAGATALTECAVRGVEMQGGRVSGVVTEKGRIGCDAVVLAGGAWSRLFCGNAGIELPQLKVLASVFRTAPLDGGPDVAASGSMAVIRLPGVMRMWRTSRRTRSGCCCNICRRCGRIMARSACGLVGSSWRNGACGGAGHSTKQRRSRRCACLTRSRGRRCWKRRVPCCLVRSLRLRGCRWRKAGAG